MFKYSKDGSVILLIVYMDDLAFAGNDDKLIAEFKKLRDAGLADIVTLREFLDQSLDGAISTCFGVEQSEKIRCIHDFKKSCINACTTIYSKIQLQDLRHLRVICLTVLQK